MGQKDIKAKKQFSGSIGYRQAQLRTLRGLLRGSVGVADFPSCAGCRFVIAGRRASRTVQKGAKVRRVGRRTGRTAERRLFGEGLRGD